MQIEIMISRLHTPSTCHAGRAADTQVLLVRRPKYITGARPSIPSGSLLGWLVGVRSGPARVYYAWLVWEGNL